MSVVYKRPVDEPKIFKRNRPLDFGEGFYLTTNKEQAKQWAKRVALRNNSEISYEQKSFDNTL